MSTKEETPPSVVPGPTVAQIGDVERALRVVHADTPTLVGCEWCAGHGMVTPEKAAEWRAAYPELTQNVEASR